MTARVKTLLILFGILGLFSQCDDGSPKPNQAPSTQIFLDEINLEGEDRLTSVVSLYWSGNDRDGYVVGFEYSFDNENWYFTTRRDSTFRFELNQDADTLDIDFFVRAKDDKGLLDPDAAYLRIPVKNTVPEVSFDEDFQPVDTTNTVFSLVWTATDLDGDETLDSTYIKINEGPWTALARNVNCIRVSPVDPFVNGPVSARVLSSFTEAPTYIIDQEQEEPNLFEGLILEGENQVFVRVKDKANAFSEPDTSSFFYLKAQTTNLLVVDGHNAGASVLNLYDQVFKNKGISYDHINLAENKAAEDIRFWNFNYPLLIDLYEKVYWYDGGVEQFVTGLLFFEVGIFSTLEYIATGGKFMISTFISGNHPSNSVYFVSTPMDSITTQYPNGQGRYLPVSSTGTPDTLNQAVSGYPTIICNEAILNVGPFYKKPLAAPFYNAPATAAGTWDGPDNVGAYFRNINGNANFIFFCIELHKWNQDPQAFEDLMDLCLNDLLGW